MTPEEATGRGIAQAEAGATDEFKRAAFGIVKQLAARGTPFTPDDVWDYIEKPREPRALGPVMLKASKAGLIIPTGRFVYSRNASQHMNLLREWIGFE